MHMYTHVHTCLDHRTHMCIHAPYQSHPHVCFIYIPHTSLAYSVYMETISKTCISLHTRVWVCGCVGVWVYAIPVQRHTLLRIISFSYSPFYFLSLSLSCSLSPFHTHTHTHTHIHIHIDARGSVNAKISVLLLSAQPRFPRPSLPYPPAS